MFGRSAIKLNNRSNLCRSWRAPRHDRFGAISAIASPEPPASAGKSFGLGQACRIGNTVSA
jgi:hypothetical protein